MTEIWEYIESDYKRYYKVKRGGWPHILFVALTASNPCFAYSFWLRLSMKKNIFWIIAKWMHYRLSRKYGILIPSRTKIGYGLHIGHHVGIVINGGTVIGNNCGISHFVSIGTNRKTPAVIGDDVYIGPHVSIVEDVKIGNNVVIGAGSVIIKDIPDNATVVGNPGRVVKIRKPDDPRF